MPAAVCWQLVRVCLVVVPYCSAWSSGHNSTLMKPDTFPTDRWRQACTLLSPVVAADSFCHGGYNFSSACWHVAAVVLMHPGLGHTLRLGCRPLCVVRPEHLVARTYCIEYTPASMPNDGAVFLFILLNTAFSLGRLLVERWRLWSCTRCAVLLFYWHYFFRLAAPKVSRKNSAMHASCMLRGPASVFYAAC